MTISTNYPPNTSYNLQATVANTQTVSVAVDLFGNVLAGIFIPAEFDGTEITFQTSPTLDGTYVAVRNGDGSNFAITTQASRYEPIRTLGVFAAVRFLRVVCTTAQTGATTFTLATRPIM